MRAWLGTVATAAAGGAVTTVLLLAAGAVQLRDAAVAGDPPLAARGLLAAAAPRAGALSAREIYERAAPAVVSVRARVLRPERTPFAAGRQSGAVSAGSGFVLDAGRGLVICSAHTVAGATEISVILTDGRTLPAAALGRDDDTDLALLAVDADGLDLPSLELSERGAVSVGEPTLALHSAGAAPPVLTTGVVSAPSGRVVGDDGFAVDGVIQTDAPAPPDATGGPVLDRSGRVIGVSGHLIAAGVPVGFVVPAATVAQVVPQLEASGRVRRAFLGIRPEGAAGGVRVAAVRPRSPAAAAGLRRGDVVRELAGVRVRSVDELCRALAARRPGERVALEIARGARRPTVALRLAERPPRTVDR